LSSGIRLAVELRSAAKCSGLLCGHLALSIGCMRNVYASKIEAARNSRFQLTELAMDMRPIADAILADHTDANRRKVSETMKQEILEALDAIDALQDWPSVPHYSPMTDRWDDELEPHPVPLPEKGMLVTLRDVGAYIEKLPKKDHDRPEWQTAIRDLMRAAEGHGPWRFFARIAIMRALYGKALPLIGNPSNAPPGPKWRGRGKRDPWR
jgi:hypothetical protein